MGNTINLNDMKPVARPLLPIFFILDTSGSMIGQPISMLNHAMEEVHNIVGNFAASNSDALLKIGILQFSSGVKWIQPKGLEEFGDFIYNPLAAGGLTDIGAALNELNEKLSRKTFLVSTTGRCKPIIIFMTDGQPTDNWEAALKNINENNKWYQNAIKIGFAVGDQANTTILSQIVGNSEAVIQVFDLATFDILLQKVAINSAMIGSQSHLAGDVPSGEEIVRATIDETGKAEEAKTAGEMGVIVTPPAVDPAVPEPDPWGSDDWDERSVCRKGCL